MPLYEVHWTEVYEANLESTIEADNEEHLEAQWAEIAQGPGPSSLALDALQQVDGFITYIDEVIPKTYLATFSYADTRGKEESRSAILYREEATYYKAVCLTSRAYRTFRKDRMRKLVLKEVDLNHEDYIDYT